MIQDHNGKRSSATGGDGQMQRANFSTHSPVGHGIFSALDVKFTKKIGIPRKGNFYSSILPVIKRINIFFSAVTVKTFDDVFFIFFIR